MKRLSKSRFRQGSEPRTVSTLKERGGTPSMIALGTASTVREDPEPLPNLNPPCAAMFDDPEEA